MNLNALLKLAGLDFIIDKMLDNENLTPDFVKECEKTVINEIKSFTGKATQKCGEELREIVESKDGELLDSICEANRIYFRNGMAVGAMLLLQLLGL